MTAPLLELEQLTVSYGGSPAVDSVSLTIGDGETVALLGPNGAGKSSLLRAIVGLSPTTGNIRLGGSSLEGLPVQARIRLGIGYVPEGRRVFAGLSVRDNLEAAIFAPAAERGRRIETVYHLFPQLRARDRDAAWQLSGGQQQMLAIGRALVQQPRLLVLDEPSLGLAPVLAREVIETLASIAGSGTAILIAEQNIRLAASIADRAIFIEGGKIRTVRTRRQLHEEPLPASLRPAGQESDRSRP